MDWKSYSTALLLTTERNRTCCSLPPSSTSASPTIWRSLPTKYLLGRGLLREVVPSWWFLLRLVLWCHFSCPGIPKVESPLAGKPRGSGRRADTCGQKDLGNAGQLCHLLEGTGADAEQEELRVGML